MALSPLFMWLCVAMMLSACAAFEGKDAAWLDEAQGHATQEQIRGRWGEPVSIQALESGESRWIYEKREEQPGNRYTAPGTWCEQYILNFDRQSVLRNWNRREYFHGGELMPKECVPEAGTAQP
ncbi:hypothetical protein [Nitrospira sp. Nam80]